MKQPHIQDYLHFYCGITVKVDRGEFKFDEGILRGTTDKRALIENDYKIHEVEFVDVHLPLRPLHTMTPLEFNELCEQKFTAATAYRLIKDISENSYQLYTFLAKFDDGLILSRFFKGGYDIFNLIGTSSFAFNRTKK